MSEQTIEPCYGQCGLQQLREDLKVNAAMLAKQCDLARAAELERDAAQQALARLTAEHERRTKALDETQQASIQRFEDLSALRASVEALKPYLQHTAECERHGGFDSRFEVVVRENRDCTCGLADHLATLGAQP